MPPFCTGKYSIFSEDYWNWDDIKKLEIESIAAPRSFIFLWCGSTDGLDYGRQCLQKWGYRRCEDICWVKTNFRHGEEKTTVKTIWSGQLVFLLETFF